MITIFDFKKNREKIAVITDDNVQYSYNDLDVMQKEFNSFLNRRDLIIICCSNQIGSLIGYISCIQNHIVPILLGEKTTVSLLKMIIETYNPQYLWIPVDNKLYECDDCVYKKYGYKLIKRNCGKIDMLDDLALLIPTSGTTGNQKLVRISYYNILENTKSIISALNITMDEKAITSLPMNYVYGLSVINTHLFAGASILLTSGKVYDVKFWSFFNRYQGTSFAGVPYLYDLLKQINFFKFNLPTLKTMTQAGGKISYDTLKSFLDFSLATQKKFIVMYGQTEATARMSYLPFELLPFKMGSVGMPIEGGCIEIFDNSNTSVVKKPNMIGEIVFKGKSVSLGYAGDSKDLILGDVNKGILYTGDLGYFDEDGCFYIVGRKDRLIKILGIRINLDEIENVLKKTYKVDELLCVYNNEHIYIVTPNQSIEQRIIEFISWYTGLNHKCFSVLVSEIPRKENGKVDYLYFNRNDMT